MTGMAKTRIVILLGLGILALALAGFWGIKAKDKPMEATNDNPPAERAIPLIDRTIPSSIETATFALG